MTQEAPKPKKPRLIYKDTWVVAIPVKREDLPDIDDFLKAKRDEEMMGWDYRPNDDPDDITNYFEPYQND